MTTNDSGLWDYGDETFGADLSGYSVEATDGGIGKVDEVTNDAGSSYIVVDTGPWIFGKKVMYRLRSAAPNAGVIVVGG